MWQLKGQPGGLQERIWEKEGGKGQKPRTPVGSCGRVGVTAALAWEKSPKDSAQCPV